MKRINFKRFIANVFYAFLILSAATVCSARAEDYNHGKIVQDNKLQLATYSILNTDTPVDLNAPAGNAPIEPQTDQDAAPLKMVPISALNDQSSKPDAPSQSASPEVKPVAKPEAAPKSTIIPKAESFSTNVKPEKPVKKHSIVTKSPKTSETEKVNQTKEAPKESTSDGWSPVSRKKVSILDNGQLESDLPKSQFELSVTPSTLPEPQEMFEDAETEDVATEDVATEEEQEDPSDLDIANLKTDLPEPDESLAPNLDSEDSLAEPAQTPKADTRMVEIVNDGLNNDAQQSPADNVNDSIANTDDYEEELDLPTGADKFNYNPFAAAAKAKIETVNNVEVHVLEFESLIPGVTTVKKALSRWGEPNNKMENKSTSVYQYFRPIKNVASEVQTVFENGKLTTVLIQFEQPETIENLEAQYKLSDVKPIVVYQKDGTAVGQAYPERGASFVYAQNSENPKAISRLILEPINSAAFVLRAESTLKENPSFAKADLEFVLNKDPRNAKAQWLYGRVLASFGDLNAAIEHLEKAVFLKNNEPRYYINLSLTRSEAGLAELADKAADKAIELADNKDNPKPHLVAEAWRIKGDLESNKQNPNFKAAIDMHSKAIVLAQKQLSNPQPETAQAALETLVDAHLGAARDVAWGNWNQKPSSVMRWLNQANKYNERLIQTSNCSERQIYQSRVRLASKALSAIAGVGKEINPIQWAEMLTENGDKLLAIMDSPKEKEHLMWNIGMSLYDAVQVFQARKDNEMTLKYGQKAVECLEGASAYANKTLGKVSASDLYIQGRLYFRIGAIFAISKKDHQQAVQWYSKSLPIFENVADAIPRVELGRLGETLVSMGVSYWETGKQTQALNLTENGIYCLEQAAEEGLASSRSLEIPYRNLSMMLNYQGKKQESSQYIQKAEALKTSVR